MNNRGLGCAGEAEGHRGWPLCTTTNTRQTWMYDVNTTNDFEELNRTFDTSRVQDDKTFKILIVLSGEAGAALVSPDEREVHVVVG